MVELHRPGRGTTALLQSVTQSLMELRTLKNAHPLGQTHTLQGIRHPIEM